jgi:hypothetical protein
MEREVEGQSLEVKTLKQKRVNADHGRKRGSVARWKNAIFGGFDDVAIKLFFLPILVVFFLILVHLILSICFSGEYWYDNWLNLFEGINFPLVSIALYSAVFTLLSVRETIRGREHNVAPTLFLGTKRSEEIGIVNLGEGPAHQLSVHYEVSDVDQDAEDSGGSEQESDDSGESDQDSDDGKSSDKESNCIDSVQHEIVRVDEFIPFEEDFSEVVDDSTKSVTFEFGYRDNAGDVRGPIFTRIEPNDIKEYLE